MTRGRMISAALLAAIILASGCNQKPEETPQLTPVKVQIKWLHQAQFAGNYVALEKGFYENQGIRITELRPFDYVHYPIDAVENKEADFGITSMDEMITAKAEGKAKHVKAIAVIYRTTPICLYSLKESGIKKPQDLIGKTVGIERAADGTEINIGILYKAMMNRLGLNRSQVKEVTIGYDATELLSGKTDASSGYVINEPQGAIEAGRDVNIILMAEYGVNMPADIIITHEDTIRDNPKLVLGFLKATLDGWQYAIENEEYAVNATLKYAVNRTRSHEAYMMSMSIPLIYNGNMHIGSMDKQEWEAAQRILLDQGIIKEGIDLESAYTTAFLEKIYGL